MKVVSPYNEADFIEYPDTWLGKHSKRHDDAVNAAKEAELPTTWRDFSVAMALLDDWHLPGIAKNPEKWDLGEMPLNVMIWVKTAVLESYYGCYLIPKNSSPLS